MIVFNHLPVVPLRITSNFGKRNTGIQGASTEHRGIDLGRDFSKAETTIFNVSDGTVIGNYWNDVRGWVVVIDHGEFKTLYQHLKAQSPLKAGRKVRSGQQIGVMGKSSKKLKIATHLHFELRVNDNPIDPLPYLQEEDMTQEKFNEMMDNYLSELAEKEPSDWSKEQRKWAETNGLITGDTKGNKQYKSFVTREQIAILFKRLFDLVK